MFVDFPKVPSSIIICNGTGLTGRVIKLDDYVNCDFICKTESNILTSSCV